MAFPLRCWPPLLAAQVETGESGTEARLVQNSRPGSWQPIGSIVSSCASFGAHGFTGQSSVTNQANCQSDLCAEWGSIDHAPPHFQPRYDLRMFSVGRPM